MPEGGHVSSLFQRLRLAIRQMIRQTWGRIGEIFREHPGALVSALGLSPGQLGIRVR